jgi:hypothetical protein
LLAERENQVLARQAEAEVRTEIVNLGYDLDAPEGSDAQLELAQFLAIAQALDGDLGKAKEKMDQLHQAKIDAYLAGKRADAQRPTPVGAHGAGPAPQERPLVTMEDAAAARDARLEAAFGPARRR